MILHLITYVSDGGTKNFTRHQVLACADHSWKSLMRRKPIWAIWFMYDRTEKAMAVYKIHGEP